jgi:hypothetical protein
MTVPFFPSTLTKLLLDVLFLVLLVVVPLLTKKAHNVLLKLEEYYQHEVPVRYMSMLHQIVYEATHAALQKGLTGQSLVDDIEKAAISFLGRRGIHVDPAEVSLFVHAYLQDVDEMGSVKEEPTPPPAPPSTEPTTK